jgi:DNA-binding NarL/FixJ family response regulator
MANRGIKIALISDSKLILNGIRKILEFEAGMTIVAEGAGLRNLKNFAKETSPDFIFLDNRESAYDIEKIMRSGDIKRSAIRVIQFTEGGTSGEGIPNLINVNHETTSTELVEVIKRVTGKNPAPAIKKTDETKPSKITKTEARIIKHIAAGESNKDIAELLSVSEKTVKAHITNIFHKLHLQNRYQLMIYGKRKKKNIEVNL